MRKENQQKKNTYDYDTPTPYYQNNVEFGTKSSFINSNIKMQKKKNPTSNWAHFQALKSQSELVQNSRVLPYTEVKRWKFILIKSKEWISLDQVFRTLLKKGNILNCVEKCWKIVEKINDSLKSRKIAVVVVINPKN